MKFFKSRILVLDWQCVYFYFRPRWASTNLCRYWVWPCIRLQKEQKEGAKKAHAGKRYRLQHSEFFPNSTLKKSVCVGRGFKKAPTRTSGINGSQTTSTRKVRPCKLLYTAKINKTRRYREGEGRYIASPHTPVPCTTLHERFPLGGGILNKLRTKVPKSSVRSSNSGAEYS